MKTLAITLHFLLLLAGLAPGSELRAGAAISNITPPLDSLIIGGFVPIPATNVHDELHARCLVIDDGKTRLALVVCDLLGLHRSVSVEARRMIEESTGIPASHVAIMGTHTHSAAPAHAPYTDSSVPRFVDELASRETKKNLQLDSRRFHGRRRDNKK